MPPVPVIHNALTAGRPIAIFGDVDLGIWGLLICGQSPQLALAAPAAEPAEIRLEPATIDREDNEVWLVESGHHSLRLERAQATTLTPGADLGVQPLRVTGTAMLAGEAVEIDVAGALTESQLNSGDDSLRVFGAWFPAGHQVVLRAQRPRGAKGQDRDLIDAVAIGESEELIFDPRLSTTYDAARTTRQAGIELWIGADEDGDQYPRRVSAVAAGASISGSSGGAELKATALHCVSRGEAGTGVYVLVSAA